MLSTFQSKSRLVFVAVVILITACLSLGVYSARKQQPTAHQQNRPTKEWLFSIPAVQSKVKDLEIVNVRIVRSNTDAPGVAFDILNKGGRPVMAIEISCGNGAISQDGLEDEEHPKVIIEPYGTLSAEMTGELTPGAPIVVASATFKDGKEEGDATSLDFMREVRKTERAQRAAEKKAQSAERNSNK